MPTAARTAAVYFRYSTRQQDATSIDAQRRACAARAERLGRGGAVEHADPERSGGTIHGRAGYLRLKDGIAEGHFDVVIVDEIARLARDTREVLAFRDLCAFHGVKLHDTRSDIDYAADESHIFTALQGLLAEDYRRSIGKNTRRTMVDRAHAGLHTGGSHFGYRSVDGFERDEQRRKRPRKRLEIDPATAPIVRRVFALRCEGWGWRAIAAHLNDPARADAVLAAFAGAPVPWPSRGQLRDTGGWTMGAVREIVRNPKYKGVWRYGVTRKTKHPETDRKMCVPARTAPIVATWPELALVDAVTWQVAQHAGITGRPAAAAVGPKQAHYLLSGLLRCPICHAGLTILGGSKQRTDGSTIRYYRCPAAAEKRCTWTAGVNLERAEQAVLGAVRDVFSTPERLAELTVAMTRYLADHDAGQADTRDRLEGRQAALRARLNNLVTSLGAVDAGPAREAVVAQINAFNVEAAAVAAELAALPSGVTRLVQPAEVRGLLEALPVALSAGPADARVRELVHGLFDGPLTVEPTAERDAATGRARNGFVLTGALTCAGLLTASTASGGPHSAKRWLLGREGEARSDLAGVVIPLEIAV